MNAISLVDGNINNDDLIAELQAIKQNTSETTINAGDIELHVDGLEGLQTTTNSTLSTINSTLGDTNNKIDAMRANDTLTTVKSSIDTLETSLTSMEAKMDVDNVVYDNQLTKMTEIDTALDTIDSVLDNSLVKQTNIETLITTLDGVADNQLTKLGEIETSLTSMEGKQDTQITHLSEIEGAVETLEACVGSNKVNVNISSGNISGFATQSTLASLLSSSQIISEDFTACNTGAVVISSSALPSGASTSALQGTTNTKLDTLETSNQLINTTCSSRLATVNTSVGALTTANHTDLVALESSLTSMEGKIDTLDTVQDNALTKLGEIETSCDALISANHTDLVALESSLTAIEGKQDTIITHLSEIEGATETIETAYGLNKCNINISSDAVGLATSTLQGTINTSLGTLETSLTSMEGKQDTQITHLSEIEGAVETIEACVGSNKVNVNISSGNISGFATSTLQGTTNTKLDTIIGHNDGVETLLTAIDGVCDNILIKETLSTTAEIKELLSGATVNAGVLSAELDTEHYERIRLFGETSASTGSDIKIFGSNTSGGTYYYLNNGDLQAQSLLVSGLGSVHYIGGSFENIPRYIKIFNNNGSTNYTFTKLYMVGSGGRVAV